MGLKEDIAAERESNRRSRAAERLDSAELPGRIDGEELSRYCSMCEQIRIFYLIGEQERVGSMYNCSVCETTRNIAA